MELEKQNIEMARKLLEKAMAALDQKIAFLPVNEEAITLDQTVAIMENFDVVNELRNIIINQINYLEKEAKEKVEARQFVQNLYSEWFEKTLAKIDGEAGNLIVNESYYEHLKRLKKFFNKKIDEDITSNDELMQIRNAIEVTRKGSGSRIKELFGPTDAHLSYIIKQKTQSSVLPSDDLRKMSIIQKRVELTASQIRSTTHFSQLEKSINSGLTSSTQLSKEKIKDKINKNLPFEMLKLSFERKNAVAHTVKEKIEWIEYVLKVFEDEKYEKEIEKIIIEEINSLLDPIKSKNMSIVDKIQFLDQLVANRNCGKKVIDAYHHVNEILSLEIANQIIDKDREIFQKINLESFLIKNVKDKGFLAASDFLNRIGRWTSELILQPDINVRVLALSRMIMLAQYCYIQGDLNGVLALWSGIESTNVIRLKSTYENLPGNIKEMWDDLKIKLDKSKNFKKLREAIEEFNGPMVPFFGVYTSDIIHFGDGIPNASWFDVDAGIKSPKSIIKARQKIQQFGQSRLSSDNSIVDDIMSSTNYNNPEYENTLFNLSSQLEPKGAQLTPTVASALICKFTFPKQYKVPLPETAPVVLHGDRNLLLFYDELINKEGILSHHEIQNKLQNNYPNEVLEIHHHNSKKELVEVIESEWNLLKERMTGLSGAPILDNATQSSITFEQLQILNLYYKVCELVKINKESKELSLERKIYERRQKGERDGKPIYAYLDSDGKDTTDSLSDYYFLIGGKLYRRDLNKSHYNAALAKRLEEYKESEIKSEKQERLLLVNYVTNAISEIDNYLNLTLRQTLSKPIDPAVIDCIKFIVNEKYDELILLMSSSPEDREIKESLEREKVKFNHFCEKLEQEIKSPMKNYIVSVEEKVEMSKILASTIALSQTSKSKQEKQERSSEKSRSESTSAVNPMQQFIQELPFEQLEKLNMKIQTLKKEIINIKDLLETAKDSKSDPHIMPVRDQLTISQSDLNTAVQELKSSRDNLTQQIIDITNLEEWDIKDTMVVVSNFTALLTDNLVDEQMKHIQEVFVNSNKQLLEKLYNQLQLFELDYQKDESMQKLIDLTSQLSMILSSLENYWKDDYVERIKIFKESYKQFSSFIKSSKVLADYYAVLSGSGKTNISRDIEVSEQPTEIAIKSIETVVAQSAINREQELPKNSPQLSIVQPDPVVEDIIPRDWIKESEQYRRVFEIKSVKVKPEFKVVIKEGDLTDEQLMAYSNVHGSVFNSLTKTVWMVMNGGRQFHMPGEEIPRSSPNGKAFATAVSNNPNRLMNEDEFIYAQAINRYVIADIKNSTNSHQVITTPHVYIAATAAPQLDDPNLWDYHLLIVDPVQNTEENVLNLMQKANTIKKPDDVLANRLNLINEKIPIYAVMYGDYNKHGENSRYLPLKNKSGLFIIRKPDGSYTTSNELNNECVFIDKEAYIQTKVRELEAKMKGFDNWLVSQNKEGEWRALDAGVGAFAWLGGLGPTTHANLLELHDQAYQRVLRDNQFKKIKAIHSQRNIFNIPLIDIEFKKLPDGMTFDQIDTDFSNCAEGRLMGIDACADARTPLGNEKLPQSAEPGIVNAASGARAAGSPWVSPELLHPDNWLIARRDGTQISCTEYLQSKKNVRTIEEMRAIIDEKKPSDIQDLELWNKNREKIFKLNDNKDYGALNIILKQFGERGRRQIAEVLLENVRKNILIDKDKESLIQDMKKFITTLHGMNLKHSEKLQICEDLFVMIRDKDSKIYQAEQDENPSIFEALLPADRRPALLNKQIELIRLLKDAYVDVVMDVVSSRKLQEDLGAIREKLNNKKGLVDFQNSNTPVAVSTGTRKKVDQLLVMPQMTTADKELYKEITNLKVDDLNKIVDGILKAQENNDVKTAVKYIQEYLGRRKYGILTRNFREDFIEMAIEKGDYEKLNKNTNKMEASSPLLRLVTNAGPELKKAIAETELLNSHFWKGHDTSKNYISEALYKGRLTLEDFKKYSDKFADKKASELKLIKERTEILQAGIDSIKSDAIRSFFEKQIQDIKIDFLESDKFADFITKFINPMIAALNKKYEQTKFPLNYNELHRYLVDQEDRISFSADVGMFYNRKFADAFNKAMSHESTLVQVGAYNSEFRKISMVDFSDKFEEFEEDITRVLVSAQTVNKQDNLIFKQALDHSERLSNDYRKYQKELVQIKEHLMSIYKYIEAIKLSREEREKYTELFNTNDGVEAKLALIEVQLQKLSKINKERLEPLQKLCAPAPERSSLVDSLRATITKNFKSPL